MNILVVGMHKSGSTALFNIIRFCFIGRGDSIYSTWYGNYNEKNRKKINLVKIHNFDESLKDWADIIFNPKRGIRDSMSSNKRCLAEIRPWDKYDFEELLVRVAKQYASWKPYADYEFVYEDFIDNPTKIISEIAETLCVSVNPQNIYDSLMALTLNKNKKFGLQTPYVMCSPLSIGEMKVGGYNKYLTKEDLEIIEEYEKHNQDIMELRDRR